LLENHDADYENNESVNKPLCKPTYEDFRGEEHILLANIIEAGVFLFDVLLLFVNQALGFLLRIVNFFELDEFVVCVLLKAGANHNGNCSEDQIVQ